MGRTRKNIPELSTEELIEIWEDDSASDEFVHVNPDGTAWYANRVIADPDEDGNPDFKAIRRWMKESNYYPNIWEVNERGNVELYTSQGEPLGGLV